MRLAVQSLGLALGAAIIAVGGFWWVQDRQDREWGAILAPWDRVVIALGGVILATALVAWCR